MAQRFPSKEKRGVLTHNAGVISLAASRLTIGGQQYSTGVLSRTIATDVTMVAHGRYQVFAVLNGSNVELRISLNENSVGPTGFTAWKLVGSFQANGSSPVGWGSFLTLSGVATTLTPIPFNIAPAFSTSNGTASTASSSMTYMRSGNKVFVKVGMVITKGTGTGSIVVSGLPFSVAGSGKAEVHCGTAVTFTGLTDQYVFVRAQAGSTVLELVRVTTSQQGIGAIDATNLPVNAINLQAELTYYTSGLETAIEDL